MHVNGGDIMAFKVCLTLNSKEKTQIDFSKAKFFYDLSCNLYGRRINRTMDRRILDVSCPSEAAVAK